MFTKRSKQPPDATQTTAPPDDAPLPGAGPLPAAGDEPAGTWSKLRKWVWGWRLFAVLGGLLLVIQLVPYRVQDHPVVAEPNWDSPTTRELAVRACFGCHSNQTEKPWYSYVAPMAWLVNNHVEGGRGALNFSEWTAKQARQAEKIDRVIRDGSMPPSSYTWFGLHSESKLTPAESDALAKGLLATIAQSQ
jgi:hypothetical protein